ncbi:hypothetical protein Ancab_039244, partial [Ancistrocladus abbreviatus]
MECCGPGNKCEEMERPNDFHKLVTGSLSPSAGISQHKVASKLGKNAKKKQMEEILQLRLSKRVIGKGKKSRKNEKSKIDREDTGEINGPLSFGDSLHDSNIMNRNQIILTGNENPEHGKFGLSPIEICVFLSQLGMVEERNVEETVQQIAKIEKQDAMLFSNE